MLAKLLKYDLKNIYKVLVIFYILAIVFAAITRLFFLIDDTIILNIIGKVCSGITISMIANIVINNILRGWARFRTNIYKDESYLTHTLPVTKNSIYLSKFLSVIITMFTSMLVVSLTLFIAYYSEESLTLVKEILLPFAEIYNSTVIGLLIIVLGVLFLELIVLLQVGFTGIIIGHKFNFAKIGMSVLFGFIAYTASQIFVILCMFIIGLFNSEILDLFISTEIASVSVLKKMMYLSIGIYSLITIIIYFINAKLLKKGVNVE